MPICYHCGEEVTETYLCVKCAQNYCPLHIDPVSHECNIVQEFGRMQLNLNDYQEMESTTLKQEPIILNEIPKYNYPEVQTQSDIFDFLNEPGWLELEQFIIKNSVNEVIESQLDMRQDEKFKEFLRKNYCGSELYSNIQLFSHKPIIQDLSIWLGGIDFDGSDDFRELYNYSGCFKELLLIHYLHLRDSSYLDSITGMELFTEESLRVDIVCEGEVIISKETLTSISEHARESGDKECVGILIGDRNPDGTIHEINDYYPFGKGSMTMAQISTEDFSNALSSFTNLEDRLIGWYHSHPKTGAPTFSNADKLTHKHFKEGVSIFNFLKRFKKKIPDEDLYRFSMNLGQFSSKHIKFILGLLSRANMGIWTYFTFVARLQAYLESCYNEVGFDITEFKTQMNIKSYMELVKLIDANFDQLKSKLAPLIRRLEKKKSHGQYKLLPFLGLVICPSRRYISMMDLEGIENSTIKYLRIESN